jgi:hypothetical protein
LGAAVHSLDWTSAFGWYVMAAELSAA